MSIQPAGSRETLQRVSIHTATGSCCQGRPKKVVPFAEGSPSTVHPRMMCPHAVPGKWAPAVITLPLVPTLKKADSG